MNIGALIGLIVMVVSESATLARVEPFYHWNTPIAWTGFILFADSVAWRARSRSWIRSNPSEFVFLAVVSIPLWLVFEFFNLSIDNWFYTGLPQNFWLRQFGYAWSFATIWPAIFEGADLIDVWRVWIRRVAPASPRPASPARLASPVAPALPARIAALSIGAGAAMLVWPLVWPSPYLAAPVFLGFVFLLDPVNAMMGEDSLAGDLGRRDSRRTVNLLLSGFLCGVLWEFWNYWAGAKWHYSVPIMEHVKMFEMPVPGYFGFPAFALECFTMYVFVRAMAIRVVPSLRRTFNYAIGTGIEGPAEATAETGHYD